jgi:hypothetical protein
MGRQNLTMLILKGKSSGKKFCAFDINRHHSPDDYRRGAPLRHSADLKKYRHSSHITLHHAAPLSRGRTYRERSASPAYLCIQTWLR